MAPLYTLFPSHAAIYSGSPYFEALQYICIMELSALIPHMEALIFASDKPLTEAELEELINQAFAFLEQRLEPDQLTAGLEAIQQKYDQDFYPFTIKKSGGGWQFLTKPAFQPTIAHLNGDKFLRKLSNAALETLAIIAYKQPVTKGEIEAIRGVNSDYSVQKLLEKELIIISGRSEELPGKPLLYNTSKSFMDYFGINSPADLPKVNEVLAAQAAEATNISLQNYLPVVSPEAPVQAAIAPPEMFTLQKEQEN